jgi:Flp pilus assembly protein TadD
LIRAESDYIDALTIDKTYETAWKNLGLLYARTRRYEQAVEVLQISGDKPVALNDVGYIAMLNQDYPEAEALLDEALRSSPRHFETAFRNRELVRSRIRTSESGPR